LWLPRRGSGTTATPDAAGKEVGGFKGKERVLSHRTVPGRYPAPTPLRQSNIPAL